MRRGSRLDRGLRVAAWMAIGVLGCGALFAAGHGMFWVAEGIAGFVGRWMALTRETEQAAAISIVFGPMFGLLTWWFR